MSVSDRIVISTIYTQIRWYFTKQSTGEYDEFGDEGIDYYNGAFAEWGYMRTCYPLIMWKLYADMHLIAVRDYMVVCVRRQN